MRFPTVLAFSSLFVLAACDSPSTPTDCGTAGVSTTTGCSIAAPDDSRLLGLWVPALNVSGQYFEFRDPTQGMITMRGWVNDSIPFTYQAGGGSIHMTAGNQTAEGTYRFFGNDSMELLAGNIFKGLVLRTDSFPAPD
ncbi:MAG: hypothetical protein H6686_11855 [Fibrobacteria bacterium]|nr:hypothetical protein [Fibrobacteria bacterium]